MDRNRKIREGVTGGCIYSTYAQFMQNRINSIYMLTFGQIKISAKVSEKFCQTSRNSIDVPNTVIM